MRYPKFGVIWRLVTNISIDMPHTHPIIDIFDSTTIIWSLNYKLIFDTSTIWYIKTLKKLSKFLEKSQFNPNF